MNSVSLWIVPNAGTRCIKNDQLCFVAATLSDGSKNMDSNRRCEPCVLIITLSHVKGIKLKQYRGCEGFLSVRKKAYTNDLCFNLPFKLGVINLNKL